VEASRKSRKDNDNMVLAAGSALGLAGIDAVHVARRGIGPVYLLDMAVELFLAYAWKQQARAFKQENRG
jgi:hypothetical protein